MLRLGLIGCGEHSEGGHAVPLARYKSDYPSEIELTAACDLNPDRSQSFCRKYGFVRAYSDIDEMLAHQKLNGCIAVVPVEHIAQVGIKLLKLGIPCVVEKPLGSSLSQVTALLDAARTTRTPNMVSVNRRFMPFLNRAIDWARGVGPLRYVRCTLTRHARKEPEFLWTTAVHAVDALRHIAGDVTEANIRTLMSAADSAAWYLIDLKFDGGVLGRIDVLPTAGVLEETYELIGEGFRALVTCPFGPQRAWRGYQENRVIVEQAPEGVPEDVLSGCYDEATEFIRALSGRRSPRPAIEDVFPSVELCLRLARTADRSAGSLVPAKS